MIKLRLITLDIGNYAIALIARFASSHANSPNQHYYKKLTLKWVIHMQNFDKKVLIIYTGGTIGMKNTSRGYRPVPGFFADAVDAIADMKSEGFPSWELHEMSPILDSSNMTVREWNAIATVIYENRDRYSGFVVLHGTDTMAYTASALSFMLRGLRKPVVLTGSQIPLAELRSDGRDNLIT